MGTIQRKPNHCQSLCWSVQMLQFIWRRNGWSSDCSQPESWCTGLGQHRLVLCGHLTCRLCLCRPERGWKGDIGECFFLSTSRCASFLISGMVLVYGVGPCTIFAMIGML